MLSPLLSPSRIRRRTPWFLLLLASFWLAACELQSTDDGEDGYPNQGGSGSEIVGVVGDSTQARGKLAATSLLGLPVPGAAIYLHGSTRLPGLSDFDKAAIPNVLTGSDGSFRIRGVPPGSYVLEANDGAGGGISRRILVPLESTTLDLDTLWLKKTATLVARVDYDIPGELLFYVRVQGTRFVSRGTSQGMDLRLEGLPTGIDHTVYITVSRPLQREWIVKNVSLPEGGVLKLDTFSLP